MVARHPADRGAARSIGRVHRDRLDRLRVLASQCDVAGAVRALRAITDARQQLEREREPGAGAGGDDAGAARAARQRRLAAASRNDRRKDRLATAGRDDMSEHAAHARGRAIQGGGQGLLLRRAASTARTSGSYVVVETSHGLEIGRVVVAPDQVLASEIKEALKPIERIATPEDLEQRQRELKRTRRRASCARRSTSVAEDGAGHADRLGRVRPRRLADHVLLHRRPRTASTSGRSCASWPTRFGTKVQMLQVGERDRAKMLDGYDVCGQRLCCSSWQTSFPSVSIKMAKEQDLPLNPQKISGVCGRLYCCLTFEYEGYRELRGQMPKVGSMVSTPVGEAKVNSVNLHDEDGAALAHGTAAGHGDARRRPADAVRADGAPGRTGARDRSAAEASERRRSRRSADAEAPTVPRRRGAEGAANAPGEAGRAESAAGVGGAAGASAARRRWCAAIEAGGPSGPPPGPPPDRSSRARHTASHRT